MKKPNSFFDHTLLRADAAPEDIIKLCNEAKKYSFYSVCVNPCYAALASRQLKDTDIRVTCVCGFPLGANQTAVKMYEADAAIKSGASEIDMVINIGALKSGDTQTVSCDIAKVASVCHDNDAVLKVIIETCLLTDDEKILACRLAEKAGADFVKTSTGFAKGPEGHNGGATVHDVRLMRLNVSEKIRIKASGGIHTLSEANALVQAGADRLGCSASVSIMEEYLSYLTQED